MKLWSAFMFLVFGAGFAQEFSIKKVELTPESVILHYDLLDTIKGRTYSIYVYSSQDNFVSPLKSIKGDAGLEVRPGANKSITWHSREELGTAFQGNIELEIRGKAYIPFIKFEGFQDNQVLKRGKTRTFAWSGGGRQNILNFNLYKEDELIYVIPNVANSGSYDIELPTSIKPGKNYYFIVSDSKNRDQMMKTPFFEVKRKFPLAAKILPFALIGATYPVWSPLLFPAPDDSVESPPEVPKTTN